MNFEKEIQFIPQSKNSKDSSQIRFLLKGEEGIVQFFMTTGWRTDETKETKAKISHLYPMAFYLGFHAKEKIFDYLEPRDCDLLGICYYDGLHLNAIYLPRILIEDGHEAVWKELENYYMEIFKKLLYGDF